MASIITINPTTELDAVNAMLNAVGEAKVADLSSLQGVVELAVDTLKTTLREVQALGWRFNTEFELTLTKRASFVWIDPDGSSKLIDVFTPPTNCLEWKLSEHPSQLALDVTVRPAKQYDPTNKSLVIYDRARNRDGFPTGERASLFVDVTWGFDFLQLPVPAKRYITVRAARQLAQVMKDPDAVKFTERDEMFALRALQIAEGKKDDLNVFQSPDVSRILGGRCRVIATPGSMRRFWR